MDNTQNKTYPIGDTAKRTARGSFMSFLGEGITAFQKILFVPLFLWAWGSALYGEWLTLFSLIAYFTLADLGMANFVTNKMIQHYSRGEVANYVKTFKSALSLYALIAGVLFIPVAVFILKAPFLDWFGIDVADEWSVRIAALVLGAYVLSGSLFNLIINLYTSIGEYARYRLLSNIRELLLIGFVALVLFFGGGFVGVALWYLFLVPALAIFVWFDVKRRYPHIKFKSAKTDWKLARSFIAPGLVFMLAPLANIIKIQGSVLVIGSALGAVAVAVFSVHRAIAGLVSRIPNLVAPSFRPEIAADEARDNYDKLQLMYSVMMKTVLFLTISATVFLFFTGGGIINIWTGGKISFDPILWLVLLAGVPFYALWNFSAIFQVATNKYNQYATVRIVSAVIGLILAIIFVKFWGIIGVIAGFVLAEILLNSWIIPYRTIKIIKGNFRKFLYTLVTGVVLLLIVQAPLAFLIDNVLTNIWLKVVVMGVVVLVAGAFVTYFAWLDKDERGVVSKLLKNYMPVSLRRFSHVKALSSKR